MASAHPAQGVLLGVCKLRTSDGDVGVELACCCNGSTAPVCVAECDVCITYAV